MEKTLDEKIFGTGNSLKRKLNSSRENTFQEKLEGTSKYKYSQKVNIKYNCVRKNNIRERKCSEENY